MKNNKSQILRCSNCGAKNRVSLENKGRTPVCGKCRQTLSFPAEPVTVTDANFGETVEGSALPVLVDFWAAWCGPCRLVAPVIDELAAEFAGRAVIGKLDVDRNQMTAGRFGVRSIPTLLIFRDGREAERLIGVQSADALRQKLTRHLL